MPGTVDSCSFIEFTGDRDKELTQHKDAEGARCPGDYQALIGIEPAEVEELDEHWDERHLKRDH